MRTRWASVVYTSLSLSVGLAATTGRPGALGLLGMRERARRLGGDCVITRREPKGTLVVLTVPLAPPPHRAADSRK